MESELRTDEILNILINRFYDYQSSQGTSTSHIDVQTVLADFIKSFSNGGLKLTYVD